MPYLNIAFVLATYFCAALALHYHDEAKKYRGLAEEIGDRLNAMLLNQAAETSERERVS